MVGTPIFMAPEVRQKQYYNSKVDIWCIGTLFYEMLNGFPPFIGANIK